MEKARTKNSEMWVEGDILMMRMSGNISDEEMEEIAKTDMELVRKFKPKYVLVDSDVMKISFGARRLASSIQLGPIRKIAMICKNPVTKIIASFFLKKYRLSTPVRIFSSAEDAKEWFREV